MTERATASTPADLLPPIVRVALAQGGAHAVGALAAAFGMQFTQPALTPAQTAAWQATLLEQAAQPLLQVWASLEASLTPAAGPAVIVALLRPAIEQTAVVLTAVRQHLPQPPAETARPANGT